MSENEVKKSTNSSSLKFFFIKLISISIVIVIVVNIIFNLILAERLEKIDKILMLNKSETREEIKNKIRKELNEGLNNENLISEEDKILLYKIYLKLKKEFQDLDKNKI